MQRGSVGIYAQYRSIDEPSVSQSVSHSGRRRTLDRLIDRQARPSPTLDPPLPLPHPQLLPHVPLDLGGGRGRHRQAAHVGEGVAEPSQRTVLGAEVLAPGGDAVRLWREGCGGVGGRDVVCMGKLAGSGAEIDPPRPPPAARGGRGGIGSGRCRRRPGSPAALMTMGGRARGS